MMSLPQEIIDSIVDEIPRIEPYSDLKNCALVAKAFRHRAQHNFFPDSFHSITIPIRAQSPDLSSQLKRCKDFYELIEANPSIATFVRRITYKDIDVFDAIEAGEGHRMKALDDTAHLVDHTLPLVLDRLVNLETLILDGFDLSRVSTKFATALLKRPVTHLMLNNIYIRHLKNLLILIRSSPALRSFFLGNITLVDYEWQRLNWPYETERFTPDYDELVSSHVPHSAAEVETVAFELCKASDLLCMEALRNPGSPISLDRIENLEVYSTPEFENIPDSVNNAFLEISTWLLSLRPHLPKCSLPCLIPRDNENQPNTEGPAFPIKHVESLHVVFNLNSTDDVATSLEWWSHNFETACGQDCLIQEIVLVFSVTDPRWDISKIDFLVANWRYLDGLFAGEHLGNNDYMPLLQKVSVLFCPERAFKRSQWAGFYTRMQGLLQRIDWS
ncbi:hypothetical protein IW261DRAFT_824757 [Armillaria novae-zelandiae]|uniref:F-box domain-containing protein n=1 Tax=Armillaria novae-zelandiae TaxID=153914 RepID=A0AA39NUG8_9AGAR|nr:hypothetical protein IW261DRAFT_824757 [Armillaria novae-zelandiae]